MNENEEKKEQALDEKKIIHNKVLEINKKYEKLAKLYAQRQRSNYLVKLGLHTYNEFNAKVGLEVSDEDYEMLLKYKEIINHNQRNDTFSGVLKGMGVSSLIFICLPGIALLFGGNYLGYILLFAGLILYLILYGLGIVVANSYK